MKVLNDNITKLVVLSRKLQSDQDGLEMAIKLLEQAESLSLVGFNTTQLSVNASVLLKDAARRLARNDAQRSLLDSLLCSMVDTVEALNE